MTPPCSEQEAGLAAALADRLREKRYAVDVEELPARPPEPWLAAYAFLSAVAALLVRPAPLIAAILGIVALVLHARDSEGRPLLRHDVCAGHAVVARAPSATRPELVVLTSTTVASPRFGPGTLRGLGLTLQTAMVAIPAAAAASWIAEAETEVPGWVARATAVAAAIAVVAAVLLHRPPRGRSPSPAVDVLEELAPLLHADPVWLVAAGTGGAGPFVDAHPEVAGADWLNLEPSPGGVVAVSEEGTWRERRADRPLMGAAEEAGAEVRPHRATVTNATALLARRRRALTLMVGSDAESLRIATATARAALSRERA